MICSQCGADNPEHSLICGQCGKSFQAGTPLQAAGIVLPPGTTVPNYLVFAIISTVLCCLPTGIAAIVYAAQVNGKLQAGDIAGAQLASKNAKMWCWVSVGLGLGVGVIYGLLIAAGIMTGISHPR